MGCGCKKAIPSNVSYLGQASGRTAKQAFLRLLLQGANLPLPAIQAEVERLTGRRPADIMQAIQLLMEGENGSS